MNGRVTWVRLYGVLVHAWNQKFFEKLCLIKGSLITVDSAIEKNKRLDVARCFVRTTSMENINKIVQVMINDHVFSIKMEEEAFMCPIEIQTQKKVSIKSHVEEDDPEKSDNSSLINSIL